MGLEQTLAELESRRSGYKDFRAAVEADLAQQKANRLAAEEHAINSLIFKAAAQGASTGQIKRAYGTKDHRTISDRLKAHASEIDALRRAELAGVETMPEWLRIDGDQVVVDLPSCDSVLFDVVPLSEGEKVMFMTNTPLWNDDYTEKNEAVELLDGKTEDESEEAGIAAKFWRSR